MSETLTTLVSNEAAFPNKTEVLAGEAIPEALIISQTTVMGEIEGDEPTVRVAYAGDTEADITAEGAKITQTNATVSELVFSTQKVASLNVVSREAYSHQGVPEMLGNSIGRGIIRKADSLFFNGNATKGVKGLDKRTDIIDGGKIETDLTPLIDTLATLGANGATPTAIVSSPTAWAHLLKLTAADGRPLINPDVANATTPQLFGLPLAVNPQCPASTLFVIDRAEIISAVGTVDTGVSTERYFDDDNVGIRTTFRFGFGVLHPNRIAKLTTGTATAGKK